MEYIEIGKIINTHGIKGELKIDSYSDFDDLRFAKGNKIYMEDGNDVKEFEISSYRIHKGYVLITLAGYANINLVEGYKGRYLYMDANDRQELEDGEFYVDELIGMDVADENNNNIGKVVDVEPTNGAQNNIRVEMLDGKSFLVPYVDAFIIDINEDENTMTIHFEEELL